MKQVNAIRDHLDAIGVDYVLTEHAEVRTSAEAARIRGVDLRTGAKAMVVAAGDRLWLVVLAADRKLDWKKLRAVLGTRKVGLAPSADAERATGIQVGAIPPLGNLIGLETIFDQSVVDTDVVHFNAGSRTHSIEMRSDDLVRVVSPRVARVSAD